MFPKAVLERLQKMCEEEKKYVAFDLEGSDLYRTVKLARRISPGL